MLFAERLLLRKVFSAIVESLAVSKVFRRLPVAKFARSGSPRRGILMVSTQTTPANKPLYPFPSGTAPRAPATQLIIQSHPLPWFICKTRSRMEKSLISHLSDPKQVGFGTSFPYFLPLVYKRGKNRTINSSPMFPGFVFVSSPRIPALTQEHHRLSADAALARAKIGQSLGEATIDEQRAISIAIEACRSSKACCGFLFAKDQPRLRLELLALADESARLEQSLDPDALAQSEQERLLEFATNLRHGQKVQVVDGPMVGLEGTVFFPENGPPPTATPSDLLKPSARVLVDLHMLGRKVSVEVPLTHLTTAEFLHGN